MNKVWIRLTIGSNIPVSGFSSKELAALDLSHRCKQTIDECESFLTSDAIEYYSGMRKALGAFVESDDNYFWYGPDLIIMPIDIEE